MQGFFVFYAGEFRTFATAAEARAEAESIRDAINADQARHPSMGWRPGNDTLCWGIVNGAVSLGAPGPGNPAALVAP